LIFLNQSLEEEKRILVSRTALASGRGLGSRRVARRLYVVVEVTANSCTVLCSWLAAVYSTLFANFYIYLYSFMLAGSFHNDSAGAGTDRHPHPPTQPIFPSPRPVVAWKLDPPPSSVTPSLEESRERRFAEISAPECFARLLGTPFGSTGTGRGGGCVA
jgi:hypothetical protein